MGPDQHGPSLSSVVYDIKMCQRRLEQAHVDLACAQEAQFAPRWIRGASLIVQVTEKRLNELHQQARWIGFRTTNEPVR